MFEPQIAPEPPIYRFIKVLMHYGENLKNPVNELPGDEAMSAIDFYLSVDKVEDSQGEDRVVIIMNDKFQPHIEQRRQGARRGDDVALARAAGAARDRPLPGDEPRGAELEFFWPIIDANLLVCNRVAALPVRPDDIRHPRTPGTHPAPSGARNPHGAWHVRTPLTGRPVARWPDGRWRSRTTSAWPACR